jgi:NAD(P)-dependent dehydrogenase (short-subunit alcohol dehydrogenase family)
MGGQRLSAFLRLGLINTLVYASPIGTCPAHHRHSGVPAKLRWRETSNMGGRSIVVTGGFGVLGRAVAAAFVAEGDKVARVDFAPIPADRSAGTLDIGGVDLADPAQAARVVEQVTAAQGGIDALVNIAGGFMWTPLADGGPQAWERMFRLNTLTCATMTHAALPAIGGSNAGRIINIGAGSALIAGAGMGAYAASKSAVHKLTESLAAELVGNAITVNAVLPSIIDTPTNRADMPDADFSQWVTPAAIADVILFLASPAARAISGALLPVSKGG